MTSKPKLLAFSGSLRKDSFNHKLVAVAAKHAEAAGAEVRLIRLKDFPMAVYDGDLEAAGAWPDSLEALREHFDWADGLLISTPEYNSSISAALKNAVDWLSRPRGDIQALACIRGKTLALLAASPGALGGIRGLPIVRSLFGNIGVHVVPNQFALGTAHEAFNADGSLQDAKADAAVAGVARVLVETTAKLNA